MNLSRIKTKKCSSCKIFIYCRVAFVFEASSCPALLTRSPEIPALPGFVVEQTGNKTIIGGNFRFTAVIPSAQWRAVAMDHWGPTLQCTALEECEVDTTAVDRTSA